MNKPITRQAHGFTDYTYVPFTMYAPEMIGFARNKTAKVVCKLLSAGILACSLLTRAEWGLIPQLSFKNHLRIDALGGAAALAAPWLFGFAKNKKATSTFLVMGAFGLAAALLTQPEEMPPTEDATEEVKNQLLPS